MDMAGKWDEDQIKQAIVMATEERKIAIANDRPTKLPTKNIEVFELRGSLPEYWLKEGGDLIKHVPQMHIVCFYSGSDGNKNGITLYKGPDKPLTDNFKALKIDQVRSRGRACGKSIVETLFEPQVWNNYAGIKIKELLDSAINVLVTDSDEIGNKKLSDLKNNQVLKQEKGSSTVRLDGSLQNLPEFANYQMKQSNDARVLGSASEAALGKKIVTPVKPFTTFADAEDYHQNYHTGENRVLTRFGWVKQSYAYEQYREGCGRDEQVKSVWGKAAFTNPVK